MRKHIRSLAALTLVPLLLAACDKELDTPLASDDILGLGADLVTTGMVSYLTASGVREGRVEADTAFAYNDSSMVRLKGMRLVIYQPDGSERATVTADEAEMDETSDRMVARGNVLLVIHTDRRRIQTAELHYDPRGERIWSDSATVQTLANGSVTRGTAFESDLDFRNVRIANIRGGGGAIIF